MRYGSRLLESGDNGVCLYGKGPISDILFDVSQNQDRVLVEDS